MGSESLWKETGGEKRYLSQKAKERARRREIEEGLAKCPVCGKGAKVRIFGLGGNGLGVGCDRSVKCSRNIEYHKEGWSLEEVAEDWNRRNRGIRLLIRRIKMWFEWKFGKEAKWEKQKRKEKARIKREIEKKRREIFGNKGRKRLIDRIKFWRKGK